MRTTRREMLALTGAAGIALLLDGAVGAAPADAGAPAPTPARSATYAAVLAAVAADAHTTPVATLESFAALYAMADEAFRAWADEGLDAIESAVAGGSFVAL